MTGPDAGGTRRPARFDQPPTPTGSITTITTARTPPSEAKRQPNAFTTSRGITRRRLPLVEEGLRMPAVTAAVGVSGAAVRAVERGSTGVLAPSVSPVGRVSTSLLLGRVDQEGSLSAGRVLNGDAAGDLGRGVGRAGAVDADGDREVEAVDGSSPRGRGYGVEVPHRGAVAGRAGAVR